MQTLRDERAGQLTYNAVATGSQTAERLAADAGTNDAGLAEAAMEVALKGADSPGAAIMDAINRLRDADRFGAGEAGERARESVASLLVETDPTVLRELIRASQRAAARQRVQARRGGQRAVRGGQNVGRIVGTSIGRTTQEPVER